MRDFIVYIGYLGDVCVYVGQGNPSRHLHLNSGISHVYQANQSHFDGKIINVTVLHSGLSQKDSIDLEKECISKYKPLWNKAGMCINNKAIIIANKEVEYVFRGVTGGPLKVQYSLAKFLIKRMNESGITLVSTGEVERFGFRPKLMNEFSNTDNFPKLQKIFKVTNLGTKKGYKVELRGSLESPTEN